MNEFRHRALAFENLGLVKISGVFRYFPQFLPNTRAALGTLINILFFFFKNMSATRTCNFDFIHTPSSCMMRASMRFHLALKSE